MVNTVDIIRENLQLKQKIANIESLLKSRFSGVTDVNIHVDPLSYYNNKTNN